MAAEPPFAESPVSLTRFTRHSLLFSSSKDQRRWKSTALRATDHPALGSVAERGCMPGRDAVRWEWPRSLSHLPPTGRASGECCAGTSQTTPLQPWDHQVLHRSMSSRKLSSSGLPAQQVWTGPSLLSKHGETQQTRCRLDQCAISPGVTVRCVYFQHHQSLSPRFPVGLPRQGQVDKSSESTI